MIQSIAPPANWFEKWFDSPYYHKLYFEHDEKEAGAFLRRLVDLLQPPKGSRMLDVACGKGRHARVLADLGFDVTGFDLSPSSIQAALALESDNLHFYQHDMRLPFRANYYDYAFNFFTSFGYFKTEREHYNAIRTVSQSIKPGGTFVLDYLNVHYAEDHLVHKSEKEIDGVVFYLTKWYDETHFYKKIVIEDEMQEEPLEFIEKVAKFNLGDFNDMLAFHDLQIQSVYGDYQFAAYDVKKSPRLLIVSKKVSQ